MPMNVFKYCSNDSFMVKIVLEKMLFYLHIY